MRLVVGNDFEIQLNIYSLNCKHESQSSHCWVPHCLQNKAVECLALISLFPLFISWTQMPFSAASWDTWCSLNAPCWFHVLMSLHPTSFLLGGLPFPGSLPRTFLFIFKYLAKKSPLCCVSIYCILILIIWMYLSVVLFSVLCYKFLVGVGAVTFALSL